MNWIDGIHDFPTYLKRFMLVFTLALSFGYFAGFKFIMHTTDLEPTGIEQNYNGNEDDEEVEVMKFKKSEGEIITTIHTHALSFSLIFFSMGILILSIPISSRLKSFLLVEPFISVIITFGGIWLLWLGYSWMKYIVMLSGMLITLTFIIQILIIIYFTVLARIIK